MALSIYSLPSLINILLILLIIFLIKINLLYFLRNSSLFSFIIRFLNRWLWYYCFWLDILMTIKWIVLLMVIGVGIGTRVRVIELIMMLIMIMLL